MKGDTKLKTILTLLKKSWLYLLAFYIGNKLVQALMLVNSDDVLVKLQHLERALPVAFRNPLPSFSQEEMLGGVTALFIVAVTIINAKSKKKKMRDGVEHGSAHFGTKEELAPLIDPVFENNIILSETEFLRMTPMPKGLWQKTCNKNVLVVGGSGSGKTSSFVKPNLMQLHSSYIITDPKGSILQETGKMLEKNGYKIRFLDLIDMDMSMGYNPLAYAHTDKDVRKLVNTLMLNTKGEGTGGDSFFEDSASILLTALTSYVCMNAREEERNLNTVLDMLNTIELRDDPDFKNGIDILMEGLAKKAKKRRKPVPFCVKQYKKFQQAGYKTGQSILATANAHIATLELDEVRELIRKDGLSLDTVGDSKTALFIVIPDTDTTFNFIAAILYTQMFNLLCDKAKKCKGGKLPVHVRCILDEFANIGKIPNFEILITTIRSREISACIILQTKSQIKAAYKDHAETITGNCDSFLFLGGKEDSTIKDISELLGKETIDSRSTSENTGREKSQGQSYQRMGKELMSKDEVATMDGGKCIVQIKGCHPFLSKKYNLHSHKNYPQLSDSNPKNEFDPKKYLTSIGRVKAKKSDMVRVVTVAQGGVS